MTRLFWGTGLASALLTACGSAPSAPEPSSTASQAPPPKNAAEVRSALTEAMIQRNYCYRSDLAYCIRDPDFLDQVLTRLLGATTLQELVTDTREFQNLLREAPTSYTALQSTPDGLARLSRLTEERFAKPVYQVTGDVVRADYGHIGAKMDLNGRGSIAISFSDSPHLNEHREWKSTEVAAALKALVDQYPDANAVEVRVVIPGGLRTEEWIYKYRHTASGPAGIPVREDRIHVFLPSPPAKDFYTAAIKRDFGPYLRGERSLATRDLESPGYR